MALGLGCDSGSGGDGSADDGSAEGSTSNASATSGETVDPSTTAGTDPTSEPTSSTDPSDPTDPTDPTEGEDGSSSSGGSDDDLGERLELRIDNFAVPTDETSYKCFDFSFSLDQLGHMTAFEPVIDNAAHVHHYVVTLTEEPSGAPDGYNCFDLAGDIIWAWAPGQGRFELPSEAGFLVGDSPGGNFTLRLQVHYNNPLAVQGEVDNSGFDVWINDELRPNNAGTLVFADVDGIEIPPGQEAYEHIMTCRSGVTEAMFPGPLHLFGSSMHAHDIGSVLYTEVWRDGEMVHELNRDDPFDFEQQNFKWFEYDLLPGDEIVNHCIYDSSSRSETTYGGPGTADEMCWDTVVYYPKIPSGFDYCSSGS